MSEGSGASRLSDFGLYKAVDSRTEQFLQLSRRRQLRQGCLCAAISTAITVTIVVVILLIYEYTIAVESSIVQKRWGPHRRQNVTNATNDTPFADRLDRSYFGFDQDYYERMPLLVNAMQENSYVDPVVEMSLPNKKKPKIIVVNITKPTTTPSYVASSIRRTSPRPFIYEYKSPAPTPFSVTYGSRSWVDNYRNAQRLQNLHQILKYLEKTINAKFGDIYTKPAGTQIAFSGVYVEPMVEKQSENKEYNHALPDDLLLQGSNNLKKTVNINGIADPYYSFKPERPGDVNLLADGFFRFSPIQNWVRDRFSNKLPMFRPISYKKRYCARNHCNDNVETRTVNSQHRSYEATTFKTPEQPKTFSVMLNVIPLTPAPENEQNEGNVEGTTKLPLNNLYFTNPRPIMQFRRKSNTPIRRPYLKFRRPRVVVVKRKLISKKTDDLNLNIGEEMRGIQNEKSPGPDVIVHVNVFPPSDQEKEIKYDSNKTESTSEITTSTKLYNQGYITEYPALTHTQVEDYHVGSSGVIPVEQRTHAPETPKVTTSTESYSNTDTQQQSTPKPNIGWSTNPPDIIKFNPEDAKIPEDYLRHVTTFSSYQPSSTEFSRRSFTENEEIETHFNRNDDNHKMKEDTEYEETYNRKDNKIEYVDDESTETISARDYKKINRTETSTLITKLNNEEVTTTTECPTKRRKHIRVTTSKTYVPQINGHYRSINQNSRNINDWLDPTTTEVNRKKRLEKSVTGFKKPKNVPEYIEIKRNKTRNTTTETTPSDYDGNYEEVEENK